MPRVLRASFQSTVFSRHFKQRVPIPFIYPMFPLRPSRHTAVDVLCRRRPSRVAVRGTGGTTPMSPWRRAGRSRREDPHERVTMRRVVVKGTTRWCVNCGGASPDRRDAARDARCAGGSSRWVGS